jgi:hypothetical protein
MFVGGESLGIDKQWPGCSLAAGHSMITSALSAAPAFPLVAASRNTHK